MEETLITYGSEIKALGEGKVGGYLVRFSTAADPDLTDDFFTKETDLHIPADLPVLYNHGLDKKMGKRVIGKAVVNIDDVGAWAETQLNLRDEYEQEIYKLAEAGKLGYSSGALSHLVEREPVGKGVSFIKTWFVGEASLTPTPAEPRNSIVTLKSLITPEQAALPIEGEIKPIKSGEKIMEETDVKALVAAALKEREDAEAAKAAQLKALEDAKAEGAKSAIEELEKSGQLKKTYYHSIEKSSDSDDGVAAFKAWMQTGEKNRELIEPDEIMKGIKSTSGVFNWTTGAEGGFLVPDPLLNRIIAKRDLASWVRQAPCSYFSTVADHLLIPVENTRAADFVSTAESAAYSNDTTLNLAQKDLTLTKYTKEIKVSEEFLGAQNANWEGWIANVLARAEAGTENALATANMLDGSGATAGTAAATSASIAASDLSTLIGSLTNGYNVSSECGFLMKNATKWMVKGVAGNNFQFVATPQSGDFFGYPCYVSDDMPAATTGLYATVFGNFTYFAVLEKPGMLVQRNPYLYMASGQVGIFANIFRAYDVLVSEAFYKMAQA